MEEITISFSSKDSSDISMRYSRRVCRSRLFSPCAIPRAVKIGLVIFIIIINIVNKAVAFIVQLLRLSAGASLQKVGSEFLGVEGELSS